MLLPARTPRSLSRLFTALHRKATIASLPRRLRRMAGVTQSPLTDAAVTAFMRVAFRLLAAAPSEVKRAVVRQASPLAAPVVDHLFTGVSPLEPTVWEPEQARRRHGIPRPAERVAELAAAGAVRPRQTRAPRDDAGRLLTFRS